VLVFGGRFDVNPLLVGFGQTVCKVGFFDRDQSLADDQGA
jgi:hypothetical protein